VRNRLFATGRGGLGVQTGTGGAPTSPELQAYYNALAQQDRQIAAGAEQFGRERQAFGLDVLGRGLTTQQQAEATARQNAVQNLGLTTGLTGQALSAIQGSRQTAEQNLLNRLGLGLGYGTQAISTGLAGEDVARQRFAQDLALGTGLFGTAGQFLSQVPALQTAYLSPLQSQLGLAATVEGLGQQPFQLSTDLAAAQAGAGRGAGSAYLSGMGPAIANQQRADSYSPLGSFLSGAGSSLGGLFSMGSTAGGSFNPFNRYGGGMFDWGQVPTSVNRAWDSRE
jgi:hypothetical protein